MAESKSDCKDAITAFFTAYDEYWHHVYSIPQDDWLSRTLAEEQELLAYDRMRLHPPLATRNDLSRIGTQFNKNLPDALVDFQTRHSFYYLEVPLCSFVDPVNSRDLYREMFAICEGTPLIPFGYHNGGDDMFCVDPTRDEVVVRFEYYDRRKHVLPICKSFCHLVIILTHLILEGDARAEEFVNQVRGIDPEYFGGAAWDWWKPQLTFVD